MKLNRVIIVQPYLFWKGHYRRYFENLIADRFNYLYCDRKENSIPNSIYLKASVFDLEHSFTGFFLSRILNSFKTAWALMNISFKKSVKKLPVHFIEFEPFSFLFFESFHCKRKATVVITIHSIERTQFESNLKNFISSVQRWFYRKALRRGLRRGYTFVVHYETHRLQLQSLLGNYVNVVVNDYPAPELKRSNPKELLPTKGLLIYGQIREDKGIYEFLSHPEIKKLRITIAGKILDQRVFSLLTHKSYTFLDRFISDEELSSIMDTHSFLVLPYKLAYTGGAGPLKDAFAFGMPVIGSDIAIFNEILFSLKKGFVYKSYSDIKQFLTSITPEEYHEMSANCLSYAREVTWSRMRLKYFALYKQLEETN
jgi:glycosyltransferase involved in cell wall biosynthesis